MENGFSQNVDEETLFNGIDLSSVRTDRTTMDVSISVSRRQIFVKKLLDLLIWIKEKKKQVTRCVGEGWAAGKLNKKLIFKRQTSSTSVALFD